MSRGASGTGLPWYRAIGCTPRVIDARGCARCALRAHGTKGAREFVPGASTAGHIHVFNGSGGQFPGAPNAGGTLADPQGGELWNSAAKMSAYDSILLSCECSETNENKGGGVGVPGARQAMHDYAEAGGRVIATHYHYTWLKSSPQPDWQQVANWTASGGGSGTYDIDQTFPEGASMASWLVNVNASLTQGQIQLTDVTNSLSSVSPPAQSWIKKGDDAVRYFSFPTPTGAAAACGRVAYSDLHAMGISAGGTPFPMACPMPGGLSAQQKALEFLLFELASCE